LWRTLFTVSAKPEAKSFGRLRTGAIGLVASTLAIGGIAIGSPRSPLSRSLQWKIKSYGDSLGGRHWEVSQLLERLANESGHLQIFSN